MATFYGTSMHRPGSTNPYARIEFADERTGTADADYFSMGGGNDRIFAGLGADEVHAGRDDDVIFAGDSTAASYRAWGNDWVYGEGNNDYIYYYTTSSDVVLFGDGAGISWDDGNDYILSGSGYDRIYGGGGNDTLDGGSGNDYIYGEDLSSSGTGDDSLFGNYGNDTLIGGHGVDRLSGGPGVDFLYGGADVDYFIFNPGDTGSTYQLADEIMDFNRSYDWIDMPLRGTASNFVAGTFTSTGYTDAQIFNEAYHATLSMGSLYTKYAFVTDGTDGYLFVDGDGSGTATTGIILRGLDSVTDLRYSDII